LWLVSPFGFSLSSCWIGKAKKKAKAKTVVLLPYEKIVEEEPLSQEIGSPLFKKYFQVRGGTGCPGCLLCRHDFALTGRFGGYFKLGRIEGHMFFSPVRVTLLWIFFDLYIHNSLKCQDYPTAFRNQ
jgi:hypothetical protein